MLQVLRCHRIDNRVWENSQVVLQQGNAAVYSLAVPWTMASKDREAKAVRPRPGLLLQNSMG